MTEKKEEEPEGGPLAGLTDLLQSLDELAETGREVQEEFKKGKTGIERKVSVRHIAPSGKPGLGKRKKKRAKPEPTMEKVKAEPEEKGRLVDVFDRDGHIVVVASLPGIEEGDLDLRVAGDELKAEAKTTEWKVEKSISIPEGSSVDKILDASFKHGTL